MLQLPKKLPKSTIHYHIIRGETRRDNGLFKVELGKLNLPVNTIVAGTNNQLSNTYTNSKSKYIVFEVLLSANINMFGNIIKELENESLNGLNQMFPKYCCGGLHAHDRLEMQPQIICMYPRRRCYVWNMILPRK